MTIPERVDAAQQQLPKGSPELDVENSVNERVDGRGGITQPQSHVAQEPRRGAELATRYHHQVHDKERSPADDKGR